MFQQEASKSLAHPGAAASGQPPIAFHHPTEKTFEPGLNARRRKPLRIYKISFQTERTARAEVLRWESLGVFEEQQNLVCKCAVDRKSGKARSQRGL